MTDEQRTGQAVSDRAGLSPREKQERKERVLTQGAPSMVSSIADAVVIKDGDLFFLATPDGRVPEGHEHGFGLYYHDCRYLSSYLLALGDARPTPLVATAERGFEAVFELTNPDLRLADDRLVPKETVGITWTRLVDDEGPALREVLALRNFGREPVELPLSLTFDATFEDLHIVRELLPSETPGERRPPDWQGGNLQFSYEGKDGVYRSLTVHCSPAPQAMEGTTARFRVRLEPRESKQILVSLLVRESPDRAEARPDKDDWSDLGRLEQARHRAADQWLDRHTAIRSDNLLFNNVMDRSLRDLGILRSPLEDKTYFAAGVPWFATLFGRDSLTTALQTLAYDPAIAEQTLRLLAGYQGDAVDEWRDEQPGKILHELRVGELARLGEIPHTPYYGTVDATPLFLILLGRHAAWTGTLSLFEELRGNVERALAWMACHGDGDGDGYIEYESSSEQGLINQGWKDSGDAIVDADGSLAEPPIALAEVQGYAYLAKVTVADLFERAGEPGRADRLRREAEELRARFNRDFWMEDQGCYMLALQAGKRPIAVVSSNAGQVLWTGIAEPDKARRTAERLMADDMYSGWGVRTLSSRERRYNPLGYHLGTVWPHDNALIAAGCRRYRLDAPARRIFGGLLDAVMHFEHYRLPELFAGFRRDGYHVPVRYPVACHPQAWAAGSVPHLVETALGLVPEAFERRLRIVRPALPPFTDWVEVRRLRVGDARVDVRFERSPSGGIAANVLKVDGELDVLMGLEAVESAS